MINVDYQYEYDDIVWSNQKIFELTHRLYGGPLSW